MRRAGEGFRARCAQAHAGARPTRAAAGMLAFAAAFLLSAGRASAQGPSVGPPRGHGPLGNVELRIEPRFGMLLPGQYLYVQYQAYDPLEWTTGAMGRTGIGGVSVELKLADGIRVRGTAMRSVRGWLFARHALLIPPIGYNPAAVDTATFDVPAVLTTGTLELILPTWIHPLGTQPYVLAGFTGKRYSFGQPTATDTANALLPKNGVVRAWDLGGGLEFTLLRLHIDLQARDTIGRYWGGTQHDIIATAGIVWRVF